MTLELMDPGGSTTTEERSVAPRIRDLTGLRIGLLTNGKHNADLLLRETASLFELEHKCEVVHFVDKKNASRPATSEHLDELAEQCDFLITAVGD